MAPRQVPSSPAAWPAAIHLALLASIIALPLLALLGVCSTRTVSAERQQIEQRLVQVAEDLVADLDRDIDRHFTILQTLISSRSLAERTMPASMPARRSACATRAVSS